MIKKDKKGIAYFTLIGPFVLILLGLLFLAYINPTSTTTEEIDFGNTLISLDLINAKLPAEEFFMKQQLGAVIQNAKEEFVEENIQTQFLQRAETSSENPGSGCDLKPNYELDLWYNQINEDANQENSNNYDEKEVITDAKDEEAKKEEDKFCSCLPDFENNLEEELQSYFEEKIEYEVNNALEAQKISKSPKIKTEYNKETNKIDVDITTYYKESSKIGDVILEIDYQDSYELDSYPQLLETLTNVIPKIPDQLKNKIPNCITSKANTLEEANAESICLQETIYNLIKQEDDKISKEYSFEINRLEEYEISGYIAIQFIVKNKKTKKQELNFGIVVKDNIPYSLIDFTLEPSLTYDNLLNIEITKPNFNSKIENYVILYSYEDFFNPTSKSYLNLLNLLKNGNVPNGFEKTGYTDSKTSKTYYYSSPQIESDISLILVTNTENDKKIENKKDPKKVQIYQIYNSETKRFELLENKPIHVFIFAVDKNLNYYVEDLKGKAKTTIPISSSKPKPLKEEQVSIEGEIVSSIGYQSTLSLQIKNYEDPNLNHFDIYLLEEGGTMKEFCGEGSSSCYYFNGQNDIISASNNVRYLITSDLSTKPTIIGEGFEEKIITTDRFTGKPTLLNSIKGGSPQYQISIVPVNDKGEGITEPYAGKNYEYQEKGKINYELVLSNSQELMKPYTKNKINIIDKKEPDIRNSIKIDEELKVFNNNQLSLTWEPAPGEEIEKLKVKIEKDGVFTSIQDVTITGIIPTSDLDTFETFRLIEIIPYDKSGNHPAENNPNTYTTTLYSKLEKKSVPPESET